MTHLAAMLLWKTANLDINFKNAGVLHKSAKSVCLLLGQILSVWWPCRLRRLIRTVYLINCS